MASSSGSVSPQSSDAFFVAHGLAKYATQLVEATEAETTDDLRLLDGAMVETLIATVGLKLVSAEKLRRAIQSLDQPSPRDQPSGGAPVESALCSEEPREATAVKLEECIAICIDRSGSMGTPFAELTINEVKGAVAQRTRMEAVKAMFYAFRDRLDSMGGRGRARLGLLQYDNEVETMLGLTDRLENFERVVEDMQKRGTTAIYSSIVEASRMLAPVFASHPDADLRVLVLTDGQNNSGASPQVALAEANKVGAVVDAIIVGQSPDANLRRIVAATGGQCYQIHDLGAGFELLEAEAVVSLRARRGGADKPPFEPRPAAVDFGQIEQVRLTTSGAAAMQPVAPAMPPPPVSDPARVLRGDAAGAGGASGAAARRALTELRKLAVDGAEGVHVFPSEPDLTFWRALIEGPAGTPFETGVFALTVRLPRDYPFKPPQIRFETPVYHCNVNDSGSICLDILQHSWNPALSVSKALEAVRVLLAKPDTDNALRQWIAELTQANLKHGADDTRYPDEAQARTAKDASRSVAEWKAEWGCGASAQPKGS